MDEAPAFTLTCKVLEQRTDLSAVLIRGTVRLALQEAGLFDSAVTHQEMAVVARKLLPRELSAGGVEGAEAVCGELATRLDETPDEVDDQTPDAVFARLGLAS